MSLLRHVTWDLGDYGNPQQPQAERERATRKVLSELDADVYAVQGIMGATPHDREVNFVALAAELGLKCTGTDEAGQTVTTFDPGRGSRGVGLMWSEATVQPVSCSVRLFDQSQLAGGMALARLWVDAVPVTCASTRLVPSRPSGREDDAGYIALEAYDAGPYGIVGAAWNNVFASTTASGSYFDPDPYKGLAWHPGLWAHARRVGKTGRPMARRTAMRAVEDCGLFDPAAWTGAAWYRTTGHWEPGAVEQRIDGPMVTDAVADAVERITAIDNPVTAAPRSASGLSPYLPILMVVDLARLPIRD